MDARPSPAGRDTGRAMSQDERGPHSAGLREREEKRPQLWGRSDATLGALLGACRSSLREAHRALPVDLEVRVLADARGGWVEVVPERVD